MGFKISANDRDVIQDIKKMADCREFDILVIYMSDNLGRIADETPLIVSYLNQRGITVFSYTEGEISAKDHTSKLIMVACVTDQTILSGQSIIWGVNSVSVAD